jgi:hypothetical protein
MQTSFSTSPQQALAALASAHVGVVRRFGPDGVLYEVIDIVDLQTALVRVLTSGEEAKYPLADVIADPRH